MLMLCKKKNQQQIPLGIRSGESFWNLVLVSDFNKWKPAIGEEEWGEQKPVNLVIIMVLSVHWKRLQIMLLMMMPFPKNRRRKREKHLKRILSVQWLNNRDSLTLTCDTATATARDLFLSFFCFHCTLSRFIPFLLSSVVCFSRKKKIVNLWILCLLYCLLIKIRFSLLVIWQSGVCKKNEIIYDWMKRNEQMKNVRAQWISLLLLLLDPKRKNTKQWECNVKR